MKKIKKYPLIIFFFGFFMLFSIADVLTPDRSISQLENRALAQAPPFHVEDLVTNKWTLDYANYTKDQLLERDEWISLYSIFETLQGKLENNGIWYAKDHYQIAENSFLSEAQKQKLPLNTTAVCELAERHPGKVSLMVVPSPANILADKLRYSPPQIDENALLDDIFIKASTAGATVIDVRDIFSAHQNENLYYRTDHHWTTTGGAWFAYQEFCAAKGFTALAPRAEMVEVAGFLGTNFAKTKCFGTQPDTLVYYDIQNPLAVFSPQSGGGYAEQSGPIMQIEKLDTFDKYSAFLRGNNGYSVLEGNGNGSLLVIKDSYGNSFVPYLVENYAKIGIIDLRAWLSVDATFKDGEYDDILVLYSFEPFSQDMYANRMGTALQR